MTRAIVECRLSRAVDLTMTGGTDTDKPLSFELHLVADDGDRSRWRAGGGVRSQDLQSQCCPRIAPDHFDDVGERKIECIDECTVPLRQSHDPIALIDLSAEFGRRAFHYFDDTGIPAFRIQHRPD